MEQAATASHWPAWFIPILTHEYSCAQGGNHRTKLWGGGVGTSQPAASPAAARTEDGLCSSWGGETA